MSSLSSSQINFLLNAVNTAKQLGINNLIIEPNKVRGMDDDRTIVIFKDTGVESFEFGSIGFNRIAEFISRIDMIQGSPNFAIDVAVTSGEDPTIGYDKFDKTKKQARQPMWAKSLKLSCINTIIDYRCANPSLIESPKFNNQVELYELKSNETMLSFISKGKQAMRCEMVTFASTNQGVFLMLADDNGDALKYKFADKVYNLQEDDYDNSTFVYHYPLSSMLTIFKQNKETPFRITQKGFLTSLYNDITVYIASVNN